jgi:hypothetical protein
VYPDAQFMQPVYDEPPHWLYWPTVQAAVEVELVAVEECVVVLRVVAVVVMVVDDERVDEDIDVVFTLEVEVDEVAVVEPPVIVTLA